MTEKRENVDDQCREKIMRLVTNAEKGERCIDDKCIEKRENVEGQCKEERVGLMTGAERRG